MGERREGWPVEGSALALIQRSFGVRLPLLATSRRRGARASGPRGSARRGCARCGTTGARFRRPRRSLERRPKVSGSPAGRSPCAQATQNAHDAQPRWTIPGPALFIRPGQTRYDSGHGSCADQHIPAQQMTRRTARGRRHPPAASHRGELDPPVTDRDDGRAGPTPAFVQRLPYLPDGDAPNLGSKRRHARVASLAKGVLQRGRTSTPRRGAGPRDASR